MAKFRTKPVFIEAIQQPDLSVRVREAIRRWVDECEPGFVWTSEDVADFVECNISRLVKP
jgi:hypothetical protein